MDGIAPGKCSHCDAPLGATDKVCPACGRPLAGSAPGVSKPLTCPVCKIPVYPARMAGQDIIHCAECEGTGFRREALSKIQPRDGKEIEIGEDERHHQTPLYFEKRDKPPFLICPFCSKRMKETRLGPLAADICEKCRALWLDGAKAKHVNEILGPYKWMLLKQADTRR